MAEQQQILLHPGFHRTGTSSMQHFLWLNRDALAPHLAIRLTRHFKPVARLCTRYAMTQNPFDLTELIGELDAGFAQEPVPTGRNLLISSEMFCGEIPGHGPVTDYSAAPTLISYLAGYLQERFPAAQIRVIMTTRDADEWLFSAYRHVLRRSRIILTPEEFAETYRGATDFDAILQDIAEAIAPLDLLFLPLDHALQNPAGPGAALVDQMPLPENVHNALLPVGIGAKGAEPHLWGQFLAMNRTDAPDDQLAAQKEQMAEAVKLGHWRKV
ncbi:hypothetical protein FHS72_002212 [Loktanella ponticola]|uniref:Sulfotransferase family protein n=1 Tax=Yoonia ponticola TaxID=1524255 RepID=A0A7W9BLB7_9RHOB|nr:hypothetical protein [Yoonia ponticola]MBB5722586.1 hypothetical protein [Yoonia ponticola]